MASTPPTPKTTAEKIHIQQNIFRKFRADYSELPICGLFGSYGHGKSSLGNSLYNVVNTTEHAFVKPFPTSPDDQSKTMEWTSATITSGNVNKLKIYDNKGVGVLDKKTLKNVEDQIRGLCKDGNKVDWTASRGILDELALRVGWTKTQDPIHVCIFVFSGDNVESITRYAAFIEVLRKTGVDPIVVITKKDIANDSLETYVQALHYDRDYIFMLQNYVSDEEYQEQQREEDNLVLWRLLNRILATAELSAKRRKDIGQKNCTIL
eukprot:TRINITY_DN398_c0_g1_i1.p1 TRINITY_DN398_c0_g1~~TRINITY_DN398_c0_g1_i1.p1  ORF type:complete len:265 (-),score=20.12 TRINITY_DN398_c0_g1_i1:7-801(-)